MKKPPRKARMSRSALKRGQKPLKRTPLRRRTPLQSSSEMKRGKPLERRTRLQRGRWNRNDWEQFDRLMAAAHGGWKAKIIRRRCAVCLAEGRERDADGRRDPHHILPARYIRRYVRSLRLPADEAAKLLRSLLYDPRNGMSLCRSHHAKHESTHERVPRALIGPKAEQFAREIGLDWVLERLYA